MYLFGAMAAGFSKCKKTYLCHGCCVSTVMHKDVLAEHLVTQRCWGCTAYFLNKYCPAEIGMVMRQHQRDKSSHSEETRVSDKGQTARQSC